MFKSKPTMPEGQIDTLIGPQVVINGDFHFSGGLYVEGRIVGKLIAEEGQKAILTLADNGSVEGEIHAPVIVIHGRVDGDVFAGERVEMGAKARVEGNVHYKVVEMAAGAVLSGRLLHVEAGKHAADIDEPEAVHGLRSVGG